MLRSRKRAAGLALFLVLSARPGRLQRPRREKAARPPQEAERRWRPATPTRRTTRSQ